MTSILKTNVPGIPDSDPDYIDTKFVKAKPYFSSIEDYVDDLVYVVSWTGCAWAEMSSIPNRWHDIYLASVRKRQDAAFRKLDATLSELRSSIPATTEQSKDLVA